MRRLLALVPVPLIAIACEAPVESEPGVTSAPLCTFGEALDVYERYIEPIMADPESQSCVKCHFGVTDLTDFVRETPCHTMACMVEREDVDLVSPAQSRVLSFIENGQPGDGSIDEQVERERAGFVAWIEYAAACQAQACGEMEDPCGATVAGSGGAGPGSGGGGPGSGGNGSGAGSTGPMIGNCSEQDVLDSFVQNWWPYSNPACFDCHHEEHPPFTKVFDPPPELWMDDDPLITLYDAIGQGVFDKDDPAKSELVTKPINTGTTATAANGLVFVGVDHGGGVKLNPNAQQYNGQQRIDDMAEFLALYAACVD